MVACQQSNNADGNSQSQNESSGDASKAKAGTLISSDLTLSDSKGNQVSLSSLKGKVVFMNFWATWCPPCIEEMPTINELKQKFDGNDQIVFLTVDVDAEIEQSQAFMDNKKYSLPVYMAITDVPQDLLGNAIPTTVIINKNGELVERIEGGRDYTDSEIVSTLKNLIAQ